MFKVETKRVSERMIYIAQTVDLHQIIRGVSDGFSI